MRPTSISTVQYSPESPPDEPEAFKRWALNEFQKVSSALQLLALGHLDETYVAPTKPRNGDIRFADGTSWQPTLMGGRGFYWYDGRILNAWVKLL